MPNYNSTKAISHNKDIRHETSLKTLTIPAAAIQSEAVHREKIPRHN
jgi:hypothetical protein